MEGTSKRTSVRRWASPIIDRLVPSPKRCGTTGLLGGESVLPGLALCVRCGGTAIERITFIRPGHKVAVSLWCGQHVPGSWRLEALAGKYPGSVVRVSGVLGAC